MPLSGSIGESLKIVIDLTVMLLTLGVRLPRSTQFINADTFIKQSPEIWLVHSAEMFQLLHLSRPTACGVFFPFNLSLCL